jgi:hypothetical protein
MQSILRPSVIYTDLSSDIVSHDEDSEGVEWMYNNKIVYRGLFDPRYTEYNLNVYWLYDENLKRIGLSEHETNDPQIFHVLWIYDNPFATWFQNPEWKSTSSTLWSKMSHYAYLDCMNNNFDIDFVMKKSGGIIVKPDMLASYTYDSNTYAIFIDLDFVIYSPPL